MATLEASRTWRPGQVTSRAVPVPGPMADRGTQAATADPGTQAATADPGTQAPRRIRGLRRPRRIRGLRRPQRIRRPRRVWELRRPWRSGVLGRPWRIGELRRPMEGSPPQNFLGEAPHPRGALRSRGRRARQGQRRESWAGRDQRS